MNSLHCRSMSWVVGSTDMGSEHYCLRWNNHQSNLLGVFSQLLESESLVDVTLACTEGPSIRAHKVVLSACSSYFQALFLDHPNRHPIVILKDVRFAELRTLVDFMYKGEVNVEYCQLSALLKTAESLKVKGLADMTNINAAAVQASREREEQQSQPQSATNTGGEQSQSSQSQAQPAASLAAPSTAQTSEPMQQDEGPEERRERRERHERHERHERRERHERHERHERLERLDRHEKHREPTGKESRERERDCRDRDRERERDRGERKDEAAAEELAHELANERRSPAEAAECERLEAANECPASPLATAATTTAAAAAAVASRGAAAAGSPCPGPLALDRPRSRRDSDSPVSLEETRASLSPISVHSGPSDMSLSNNTGGIPVTPVTLPIGGLPQSRLPSPHSTEPLAGPSGLPPVQQVPLSLKKEVDWERSTEERSASSEMSTDYRLPPDPELMGMDERVFACMYCGASFLHQSKLTRHILSHSLESLKYREQAAHLQLQAQLGLEPAGLHLPPEAHYPPGAGVGPIEPMDLELAAVHSDPTSGVVLCKFCGKSFPDVGSLISHLPAHTGDRPFKCEFCGKAFKLRHHMKDHCRVHTGERPFRCSLCGKTFSRSTILKAHEKTHYPKYVRKFLSPSPVDPAEEEAPTSAPPNPPNPHSHH